MTRPPSIRPALRPQDFVACKSYAAPFARAPGYGSVERTGQGSLEATDNLNVSAVAPELGKITIDTDLHHMNRGAVARNDWGLHKSETYLAVDLPGRYLGYRPDWRLKLTAKVVVDRCFHQLTRSTVQPPPQSSRLDWKVEVQFLAADRGEVLKFPLFSRSLSGANAYERRVSPLDEGTVKTFSATTARRYVANTPSRWMVGVWSEHRAEANNVFIDSVGGLTLKLQSLEVCVVA